MQKRQGIVPFRKENNVPIILACDNKYVPFTSVLLTSLKENASPEYNYDILLFQTDISNENKALLTACLGGRDNISLRFIDVSSKIKDMKLRVFSYYSEAIYYRLFAPWILENYDKILYFDCDLVFNDDVAKLYETDMGDNLLCAVRDMGMILHKNNPHDNFPEDYYTDYLENIDINNYFNSGVLVMNLKQFRLSFTQEYMVEYIEKKQWRFPDQDVLNVICADKTVILSSKWNTMPETLGGRTIENFIKYLDPVYCQDYLQARQSPSIIHYAMREKPWKYSINLDWELAKYFWIYTFRAPTKFLVLKEKYKTCSFAELYELIEMFDKDNLHYQKDERNVIAYYDYYKLASLFKQPTSFESLSRKENSLTIVGKFVLSEVEYDMCSGIVFASDSLTIPVEIINKKPAKTFGEKVLSYEYLFSVTIPTDSIKQKNTFNLVYLVEGSEIHNGRFDFGKFFPVDRTLTKQYFKTNGVVLQAHIGQLILSPAAGRSAFRLERAYWKQLRKQYKKDYIKIILKRLLYKLIKKVYTKDIWLLSDRTNQAGDNGQALFEYLRKNKPKKVSAYFAISKDCEDYKKLKKLGHVLPVESKRFKLIRLLTDKMISSHCEDAICYPYRQPIADLLVNQSVVFLQHGITKDDISSIYNKLNKNLSLFITASPYEYEGVLSNPYYYLTEKEVKLTGFPRFDKLENNRKKIISIAPTWRKSYLRKKSDFEWELNCDFEQTDYYKAYASLLSDERLLSALKESGYVLQFVQHPLMRECLDFFPNTDLVKTVEHVEYDKVFSESALLITDYSSTAFDFAYLRKPVLYYQFDKESFFSSHTYQKGYFSYEEDGFGEVVEKESSLVDKIIEYIRKDCPLQKEYEERIDRFFAFSDKENCKRVVDEILRLDSPADETDLPQSKNLNG